MLLTQNRELKRDGVWNWTLPAWVIELPDKSHFNVCPQAGACAKLCYARNGTYLFPMVKGKHLRNLEAARDGSFAEQMRIELAHKRMRPKGEPRLIPGLDSLDHLSTPVQKWIADGGQAVRIHDSGDFFNEEYLRQWLGLASEFPDILFYAYTKEVALLKRMAESIPDNFLFCFSLGGRQDHLIDLDADIHADVFPDIDSIAEAGYMSQHDSDLLCVLLPTTRVGIPQNNIPHIRKKLDGKTFSEAQKDRSR